MAAEFEFLGALSDDIIELIKQRMLDPAAQNQIGRFRTALTQKANELRILNSQTHLIRGKQASYIDALNSKMGDYSRYGQVTIESNAEAQQKKIIKELFLLIHKILDYLSSGATATTEYAIYYNTDDQRESGTFIRRVVSSKTLYESDAFVVTEAGVMLPRNKLKDLFGKLDTLEHQFGQFSVHSTSGAYSELAKQAIEAMADLFHEMDKEVEYLTDTMKREHLGQKKWEQYLYYRNMANWGSRAQATYNKYMLNSQYGELRRAAYNRGHIGEAYERYLQTGGTDWAALFSESTGNLPWYAGGDVGSTQVKTLFTSTATRKKGESDEEYAKRAARTSNPSVQVASIESILGLTNELLILLNMRATGKNDMKARIKEQITKDFKEEQIEHKAQRVADSFADRKILELLKEVMKK